MVLHVFVEYFRVPDPQFFIVKINMGLHFLLEYWTNDGSIVVISNVIVGVLLIQLSRKSTRVSLRR